MREILTGLLERLQDFLFLVGDFFSYLLELVMTDRKARIRCLGVLAALVLLVIGGFVFSHSRNSSGKKQGDEIYPTKEVTSAPVVEEAVVTPTPVVQQAGTQDTAGQSASQDLNPAAANVSGTQADASGSSAVQAEPTQAPRSVDSAAVSTSGSLSQINEYVVKHGSSAASAASAQTASESGEETGQDVEQDSETYEEGDSGEDYDYDSGYEEDYSSYEGEESYEE